MLDALYVIIYFLINTVRPVQNKIFKMFYIYIQN